LGEIGLNASKSELNLASGIGGATLKNNRPPSIRRRSGLITSIWFCCGRLREAICQRNL